MTIADPPVAFVSQYLEAASFLVGQRVGVLSAPDVALRDLESLDDRIVAHLDGLRVSGEGARTACDLEVAEGDWGALFAAMVMALEAKDRQRTHGLVSLAEEVPALQPGVTAAFGWVSSRYLQGIVKELLTDDSRYRRLVGISCCVAHGVDPGSALSVAAVDGDPVLRSRALSAVGELGRSDLRSICERSMRDPDADCRADAVQSAVLLGNRGVALESLSCIGLTPGSSRARAFLLTLSAMSVSAAHQVLQQLGGDPQQRRWLIQGSGIAGDPAYVPWLIGHMENVETARLAGEAFSLITGVALDRSGLERQQPGGFEFGSGDDPDQSNAGVDPDEGLPWPAPEMIEKWWAANNGRFQKGHRYFMGAPVTREHCVTVVRNGYQRQRFLAAQHLCLLAPGTPLFNTGAPAWRQQRLFAEVA